MSSVSMAAAGTGTGLDVRNGSAMSSGVHGNNSANKSTLPVTLAIMDVGKSGVVVDVRHTHIVLFMGGEYWCRSWFNSQVEC